LEDYSADAKRFSQIRAELPGEGKIVSLGRDILSSLRGYRRN
jgi:hypothetical protein